MIARLRRRHRRIVFLLAIAVPLLFVLALRAREPRPRTSLPEVFESTLGEQADPGGADAVTSHRQE